MKRAIASWRRKMVNGKLARTGMKLEAYQQRFDAKAEIQAKSLVILMAPALALAVALVHASKRRYFAEHLVFSLHFYAFFLLYLSLTQPLLAGIVLHFGLEREWKTTDPVVSTLAIAAWGIYLAIAARTVYRQACWVAIVKAGVLSFAVLQILYLYRFILFFIAFKST